MDVASGTRPAGPARAKGRSGGAIPRTHPVASHTMRCMFNSQPISEMVKQAPIGRSGHYSRRLILRRSRRRDTTLAGRCGISPTSSPSSPTTTKQPRSESHSRSSAGGGSETGSTTNFLRGMLTTPPNVLLSGGTSKHPSLFLGTHTGHHDLAMLIHLFDAPVELLRRHRLTTLTSGPGLTRHEHLPPQRAPHPECPPRSKHEHPEAFAHRAQLRP